jgi:uncharacterized protein (TIGR04255 family)
VRESIDIYRSVCRANVTGRWTVTDQKLPSYDRPPVVEVAVGMSFERLPVQASVQFGAFWVAQLAAAFPTVQEQPPYVAPVERFGTASFASELALQFQPEFPSPRFWFLNQAQDELLQLQVDWLGCNWRKVQPESQYGRWPARRKAFLDFYDALSSYLEKVGLGPIMPRQCEVTYVNHVLPGQVWQEHEELHKILRLVNNIDTAYVRIEQADTRFHFTISDPDGKQIGRLHIVAVPAYLESNKTPIYRLELTARGAPLGNGITGAMTFLDQARDVIVRTFAEITSPEIQQEWGIQ